MKKLIFLVAMLGCGNEQSPAEIMVKAQVPNASCVDYGTVDGVNVVRCHIPGEQPVTGIAVYSTAYPFQFFPLKGVEKPQAKSAPVDAGVTDAPVSK